MKFTFDTNCIIDLDQNRPSAAHVRRLISAHREGWADVAFVAVSASERQPGDRYLDSFTEFEDCLRNLDIIDIPRLLGQFYWDLSYWDNAVWADENCDLEERIHNTLFPSTPFEYSDYKRMNASSTGDIKQDKAWRNKWCDRQMMWAHISNGRDVFVTSDRTFKRLTGASGFEDVRVMIPEEASGLI